MKSEKRKISDRVASERLAWLFGLETAQNPDTLRIFADTVGAKNYEFANHLGNVLVTLSDKKLRTGGYYSAIVGQAGFYYPFG